MICTPWFPAPNAAATGFWPFYSPGHVHRPLPLCSSDYPWFFITRFCKTSFPQRPAFTTLLVKHVGPNLTVQSLGKCTKWQRRAEQFLCCSVSKRQCRPRLWSCFPTWGSKREWRFTFTLSWASLCQILSWLSLHSVVISFKFWKPVLHGFKPLFGIYYSKRRSLFWREWVVDGNCKPVDVMMTFLMASLSGVLPMKCGGKTRWQRWGHVATLSWTKTPIAQLDKIFLYPFQI